MAFSQNLNFKGTVGMDVNGTWIRGDYIDELVNNWDSPIKDNSQVKIISNI